jgi:hypothetical protein
MELLVFVGKLHAILGRMVGKPEVIKDRPSKLT